MRAVFLTGLTHAVCHQPLLTLPVSGTPTLMLLAQNASLARAEPAA